MPYLLFMKNDKTIRVGAVVLHEKLFSADVLGTLHKHFNVVYSAQSSPFNMQMMHCFPPYTQQLSYDLCNESNFKTLINCIKSCARHLAVSSFLFLYLGIHWGQAISTMAILIR